MRPQGRLDGLVDLDVERDRVAARGDELVDVAAGSLIIRCASNGSAVTRRSASTVLGPNVRFGTKWPSMTSRWIRSAPARSMRRTARARLARSASRMLAATRARPARHGYAPAPAGRRIRGCARREAPRALSATRRSRRRATAGAGGSPARSAASWPQAAPISWPRLRRTVAPIAGLASVAAKRLDALIGLAVPGRVGDGVHRDEVHVGEVARAGARPARRRRRRCRSRRSIIVTS